MNPTSPAPSEGPCSQPHFRVLSNAVRSFVEASRSVDGLLQAIVREVAIRSRLLLHFESARQRRHLLYHVPLPRPRARDDTSTASRARWAVPLGESPPMPGLERALATRAAFFTPAVDLDACSEPGAPDLKHSGPNAGARMALIVPLIEQERVIGALALTRGGGCAAFERK